MNFNDIKEKEDSFQLGTYRKLPIAIERGEGVWVYDSEGKRYLDLYGGHAVALVGHCHPTIVGALKDQLEKLVFYSNVVYSSTRAQASEAIVSVAPSCMNRVFFCNSGTEANEAALKIVRKFSGKKIVIAMEGGFHGRTIGALSATGLGSYRSQFSPVLDYYRFAEFGNISSLEQALGDDAGAVITEPVQSMAGVQMASDDYYQSLRELCTKRGFVLIFDEIQSGFGRTGSWFFGDRIGVTPDIITLAKGIGGGIPIGAVLICNEIAKTIEYGEHGTTFGGGPAAARALSATIEVIKKENLVKNAAKTGEFIIKELQNISAVKDVHGRGLLLGIEVEGDAAKLRDFLLARGIITGTSVKKSVLRLLPPLILSAKDAGIFIDAMRTYK
ncbi:MAG: aminotransferase class III-fold pyridoxal phosphate-dependent enzyme [Spirochaetota bacterium]|nr:MAG: aminotransferase class III-fold pyridoxal phosphate-dependent enzyme [Spirochaetota bacterium]